MKRNLRSASNKENVVTVTATTKRISRKDTVTLQSLPPPIQPFSLTGTRSSSTKTVKNIVLGKNVDNTKKQIVKPPTVEYSIVTRSKSRQKSAEAISRNTRSKSAINHKEMKVRSGKNLQPEANLFVSQPKSLVPKTTKTQAKTSTTKKAIVKSSNEKQIKKDSLIRPIKPSHSELLQQKFPTVETATKLYSNRARSKAAMKEIGMQQSSGPTTITKSQSASTSGNSVKTMSSSEELMPSYMTLRSGVKNKIPVAAIPDNAASEAENTQLVENRRNRRNVQNETIIARSQSVPTTILRSNTRKMDQKVTKQLELSVNPNNRSITSPTAKITSGDTSVFGLVDDFTLFDISDVVDEQSLNQEQLIKTPSNRTTLKARRPLHQSTPRKQTYTGNENRLRCHSRKVNFLIFKVRVCFQSTKVFSLSLSPVMSLSLI